ncbi:MAG: hypothetical protein R3Y39_07665 [Rikenellaceae bacterium]
MKKRLYTSLLALVAITLIACTTTKSEWTHEQRKTMRRALHEYREMVYLEELTDAEFFIFSDNVTDEIEAAYPLYANILALPDMGDTIDSFVTTAIVEQLDADGANMQHIYPYRDLVKEGTLPKKLTRQQRRAFYKCLARKVNNEYSDFEQFFAAVVANTTNKGKIASMEAECALELFDWKKGESTTKK